MNTKNLIQMMAAVAALAAGQNVVYAQKTSGPSQTVVVNDTTQAMPEKDHTMSTVEPFYRYLVASPFSGSVVTYTDSYIVPADKRLVIEHVAATCYTGNTLAPTRGILTFTTSVHPFQGYFELPMVWKSFGASGISNANSPLKVIVMPGKEIKGQFQRADVAANVNSCDLQVGGYLIPAQ